MITAPIIGFALAFLFLTCQVPVLGAEAGKSDPPASSILADVAPTLGKEPKYSESPRYALLVLGTDARSQVWLVEDGKTLYVDKNANGDLTDDGPPIKPSNVRAWTGADGKSHGDFTYVLDAITPADGSNHTDFCLTRWNYGDPADRYGLNLSIDGKTPMYAGWFGTFWANSPERVPVLHFGGPLKPVKLRGKEFVLGGPGRLSVAFVNAGRGDGATTRLSIEAIAPEVEPEVTIDWPVADGASALRTTHLLTERCCYWEFYVPDHTVPDSAVAGTATLTISWPRDSFPFELTTNKLEVPVIASEP